MAETAPATGGPIPSRGGGAPRGAPGAGGGMRGARGGPPDRGMPRGRGGFVPR